MGDDDLDFTSARKKDSSSPNRKSVHQSLGGGAVADVLLWKRWSGGAFLLVAASAMWFLFERAGYSFLSLIANVLLLLVVILFFWAKSASLLNRPLPPIPNMGVSKEFVGKGVNSVGIWINRVLAVASEIYLEGNVKLFFQVVLGLWIISCIGSLFNFLTLVYIGVLLSLLVPALYDKYQDHVDDKLSVTHKVILTQYRKIDENILRKIPVPLNKEKKIQ